MSAADVLAKLDGKVISVKTVIDRGNGLCSKLSPAPSSNTPAATRRLTLMLSKRSAASPGFTQ